MATTPAKPAEPKADETAPKIKAEDLVPGPEGPAWVLTEAERPLVDRRYVVMHDGVGQWNKGDKIEGAWINDRDGIARLLLNGAIEEI